MPVHYTSGKLKHIGVSSAMCIDRIFAAICRSQEQDSNNGRTLQAIADLLQGQKLEGVQEEPED